MKLKYKKMIIMISMCTMGIGLVTFSLNGKSDKSTTDVESTAKDVATYDISATGGADTTEVNDTLMAAVPSVTPIPTVTPSPAPTAAPNPLEKNAYKEVNNLINDYFKAKLSGKKANFKGLVNDVSLVNITNIKREVKYIQNYKNITCYTKKGPIEGSYAVYVYHESKFKNIKTPAPGMVEFFVKTNSKGQPYIFMGKIDQATEEYLNNARESDDTMDLIYSVNEKYKKAVKKDNELEQFNKKLVESAKSVKNN